MHNQIVAFNLHTNGTELKTLSGLAYNGYYHVNVSGEIFSGNTFDPATSVQLLPINFMPVTANNDLLSMYNDESTDFEGEYSVFSIKNYKNDIDIPESVESADAPRIILQPDQFFRRSNSRIFTAGSEIFVDDTNNIQVALGTKVLLQFTYTSVGDVTFEWTDSYDRIVGSGSSMEIITEDADWIEESFKCTIIDDLGSDTTSDINITIINPLDHPIIFTNIVSNGSANEDIAEWQTIGESPEGIGKFLVDYELSTDEFGMAALSPGNTNSALGAIYYHKFGGATTRTRNQWYPRPEEIDELNGFNLTDDIKENYFRADTFSPVLPPQNNHSGTTKSSFQIIDLSEYTDLLSGKVYGIAGFKALMFAWLGGRADQGDKCYVELEFLDENDIEITVGRSAITINSLSVYDRIINEARIIPFAGTMAPITPFQVGYVNDATGFEYVGTFNDSNDAIELSRVQAVNTIVTSNGIEQTLQVNGLCKTQIIGRLANPTLIPPRTQKIKVTKYYIHGPGRFDLIKYGPEWEETGQSYISDAMIVGLNVRLYPILLDSDGNPIDTSVDENGDVAIKGFNMDTLPVQPNQLNFIDDADMQLESIEWINPNTSMSGNQLFVGRSNTDMSIYRQNGLTENSVLITPLGQSYIATANKSMGLLYKTILSPRADKLQVVYNDYLYTDYTIVGPTGGINSMPLIAADKAGFLQYGSGNELLADFADDNIFQ